MIAVECRWNNALYCRHVSGGDLASAPLTGKNNSVGFRTTWYIQFVADHTASTVTVPTMIRTASGALSRAMRTRRTERPRVRARLRREVVPAAREWAMCVTDQVCTEPPLHADGAAAAALHQRWYSPPVLERREVPR